MKKTSNNKSKTNFIGLTRWWLKISSCLPSGTAVWIRIMVLLLMLGMIAIVSEGGCFGKKEDKETGSSAINAPTNLFATEISATYIALAWVDNSTDEDGFKIERKEGIGGTYIQIDTVISDTTAYTSTGLSPNTRYYFRVRAYNSATHSAYCVETYATTLPLPPLAPGLLTAIAVSQSRIDLSWTDMSNNEEGFRIERKEGASGTYAEIAMVSAGVTSYSNTSGLSPNTTYWYKVRAYNAGGDGDYSNETSATTLPLAPGAPSSLIATTVSAYRIDLSWSDNSDNELGFKIERKTSGGTYVEIDSVSAGVTSYANTVGLAPATRYYYRVRAYNTGGNGVYSNETNDTTLPLPPTAPSSLTATAVSQFQINLTWVDNSTNEDGFEIERKIGAGGGWELLTILGAGRTSYSNTALSPDTTYYYKVRGYNTGGYGDYCTEAYTSTLPSQPSAPSSLVATTLSSTQISLVWTDNSSNEQGFKIYRKASGGTYAQIDTVSANVTSYPNTALSPVTTYYYQVRAYNAGGNSNYSNEASAVTLPSVPIAPSSLTAIAVSQSQLNLSWVDNSNNEQGFKVERSPDGVAYTLRSTFNANVTLFNDTGLTASTTYYYRVYGFNTGGNSSYSDAVSQTTYAPPLATPISPSGLVVTTVSLSQINLTWTDNSDNEVGFKIERKEGIGGTYAQIDTVTTGITSYSNTSGLSANTTYYYQVRAYNTQGNSDYCGSANTTTLPLAVASPTPSNALTNISLTPQIQWASAAGATSYDVYIGITTTNWSAVITNTINLYYSPTTLTFNTLYYWRVDANTSLGTTSGDIWLFTTVLNQAPSLTSPGNQIVNEGQLLTLILSGTDPDGQTLTYSAFNLPTGASFNPDTRTFTWTPSYDGAGTYSDIKFKVTDGELFSEVAITVFVQDMPIPALASSPDPAQGSINVITTTQLSWSAASGATSYDIYFGTTFTGWSPVANITSTLYAPPSTLNYGKTYFWRIDPKNNIGTNTGDIWTFTTVGSWLSLSAGDSHTIGLKSDGTLWVWGRNTEGELGSGDLTTRNTPTQLGSDTNWTAAAAGWYHTLALKSDGTLWAWGTNSNGQLGLGHFDLRNTPTQVGEDRNWSKIAAGYDFSFAIKTDGTLYSWGYNGYGQLGLADTSTRNTPTPVTGTNWIAVRAGAGHALGLKSDNTLYSWGYNGYGQLGLADTSTRNSPTQVTGTNWTDISAGAYHTLGRKSDGTLYSWGYNGGAQLGLGDYNNRISPTQVGTGTDWASLSAGGYHSLARKQNGTLWSWGFNGFGQLGLGDSGNRTSPSQITGNNWAFVSAGYYYTVANRADGTLWAWGNNSHGQLGNGNFDNQNSLTPVPAGTLPALQVTGPVPSHNATAVPVDTRLSWASATGATSYDVYFGTTTTGWTPVTNTVSTLFSPSVLQYNTQYYWRIDSRNAAGPSAGNIWSFTTLAYTAGDNWDPTDDTGAQGSALMPTPQTLTHGPHTLSASDLYDWFRINMTTGYTY
ncbi:MAG: fibronectin type III domain-containing protein, partial [Planctomycetota bacterium]|nr:fibronectin type III domain-containing protein [Planctomycetota bacterium]